MPQEGPGLILHVRLARPISSSAALSGGEHKEAAVPENSAVKVARQRSKSDHPTSEVGMCLREVRECFGVGAAAEDAAGAWEAARFKHRETDPHKIPRNVPVFWTGGSHGHGHVAIATGDSRIWSTDILRAGYFDRVPVTAIHEKWGMTLVGWTEDLNGVRVWTKP